VLVALTLSAMSEVQGARIKGERNHDTLSTFHGHSHEVVLVKRAPYKRLIVVTDGTWLDSDNGKLNGELGIPSNVTRMTLAIKTESYDGVPQIVSYNSGVGSEGGVMNKMIAGSTGLSLSEGIREAYSFLCNNYESGDEIFLIGFSRGAFIARSVAGLISAVGVLTKNGLPYLPAIFRDVQFRHNPRYQSQNPDIPFPNKPSANDPRYAEELSKRGMTDLDVTVKAIGVWDTVGSLGIPRIGILTKLGIQPEQSRVMPFFDSKLSNRIENAFQALALDETRTSFSPSVWEKPPGNRTILRQVWFPGVHSNVGGGYDDQQLANITLSWMMAQFVPFLDMSPGYLLQEARENMAYYKAHHERARTWSFGTIYDSNSGLYVLGGSTRRTPGEYYAVDPDTGRTTGRPLRDTCEYMHPSVRVRMQLEGPGVGDHGTYDPKGLDNWKLVIKYSDGEERRPIIYWKSRSHETDVSTRILHESPLWSYERELLKLYPGIDRYILRPLPTRRGSLEDY